MILNNSTVSGNAASRGGGIYNHAGNVVVLNNSTVSGNLALSFGGGFQNYGTLVVNNSTVSGNIANSNTGGISNVGGTVRLTHSTVSNNTLRGISNSGGTVTLINSIVADQASGADCAGWPLPISNGYNLASDGTCGLGATGDLSNTPALLGPLQNNGGTTLTHALHPTSQALNHIPNGVNGCGIALTTDQRGQPRPEQAGGSCAIGAVENPTPPDPLLVFNTNDSGPGSLRAAINVANSDGVFSTISFNIPGAGPHVITPGSQLPDITAPAAIDGATQPGNDGVCTAGIANRPAYKIILQGGSGFGLKLAAGSGGSTIRGLNIRNFSNSGIQIDASNSNVVECNYC